MIRFNLPNISIFKVKFTKGRPSWDVIRVRRRSMIRLLLSAERLMELALPALGMSSQVSRYCNWQRGILFLQPLSK
jgi:hypothetical protein